MSSFLNFLKELFFMDREKISYNKFWANVAYASLTGIVLKYSYLAAQVSYLELLALYIGVVIFHKGYNTFMGVKYGGSNATVTKKLDSK